MLTGMGYFGQETCEIRIENGRIYCKNVTQKDMCDGSQWGWGGTAFCPLYGFNCDLKDRAQLSSWAQHCRDFGLQQVAKLLEELLL